MTTPMHGLVLAVHPTSRGFGWVLFETPLSPIDWGMASAKRGRNAKLNARFERLLDRYDPAVFVLEEFAGREGRSIRIQELCRAMVQQAAIRTIHPVVYPRAIVQKVFAAEGASTRFEIAQAIAQKIPELSHRLPKKRKIWDAEQPRQSIFDAAALAMTYFAVTGQT